MRGEVKVVDGKTKTHLDVPYLPRLADEDCSSTETLGFGFLVPD